MADRFKPIPHPTADGVTMYAEIQGNPPDWGGHTREEIAETVKKHKETLARESDGIGEGPLIYDEATDQYRHRNRPHTSADAKIGETEAKQLETLRDKHGLKPVIVDGKYIGSVADLESANALVHGTVNADTPAGMREGREGYRGRMTPGEALAKQVEGAQKEAFVENTAAARSELGDIAAKAAEARQARDAARPKRPKTPAPSASPSTRVSGSSYRGYGYTSPASTTKPGWFKLKGGSALATIGAVGSFGAFAALSSAGPSKNLSK